MMALKSRKVGNNNDPNFEKLGNYNGPELGNYDGPGVKKLGNLCGP